MQVVGESAYPYDTLLAKSSNSSWTNAFSAVPNDIKPFGFVSGSYVVPLANRHGISN